MRKYIEIGGISGIIIIILIESKLKIVVELDK
jgi:hypothetical protein